MPEMDGLQLLENLVSYPCQVAVIMLTAYSDFEDAFHARGSRNVLPVKYVVKPIDPDELIDSIKQAFEIRQESLAEQEAIKEASEILVRRVGLTENEAYSRMHLRAHQKGVKLVSLAKAIVDAEKLLSS